MNTRAILRALVVASIVAAGCSDPAEPPPPVFTVSPAMQWSGGAFTIRSAYFVDRDTLPVLTAGPTDTMTVSRRDDSTVVATLARGPSGPVTIYLVRGTRRDSLATVQRVGFRELRVASRGLEGELFATDSAGKPFVLGGVGSEDRQPVVRLDVVTAQALVLAGFRQPANAYYGLAPTITDGVFVVRDSIYSFRLANLLATTPVVTDTVPWRDLYFSRQVAQLSSDLWLFTGAHSVYTMKGADSTDLARVHVEGPAGIFMSPRGDRTSVAGLVAGTPGDEGVPVFDNATGLVAYRLPLVRTQDAAFSPDGGRLYVVGGSTSVSDTLVVVDATTGTPLRPKLQLPEGFHAFGVTYRTGGDGQILVAAVNPSSLALLVYRAGTHELLGILPSGGNCDPFPPGWSDCWMGVLVVDDAQHTAYIVAPGIPTPIWTFDLLSMP